jgi:hypothetical protein
VHRVPAVDPATVGRMLAAERVARSTVPVKYVGLNGEDLRLDDRSVDHVFTTWTPCTIAHVETCPQRDHARAASTDGRLPGSGDPASRRRDRAQHLR